MRRVLYVLVSILSPTSSVFGIGYISNVGKRQKFLTFKCRTEMVELGRRGKVFWV